MQSSQKSITIVLWPSIGLMSCYNVKFNLSIFNINFDINHFELIII